MTSDLQDIPNGQEPLGGAVHDLRLVPVDQTSDRSLQVCRHRARFTVDSDERIVRCAACGRAVDPIAALLALAADWERWGVRRKMLENQERAAQERVEVLKREEAAIRSRISRQRKKVRLEIGVDKA